MTYADYFIILVLISSTFFGLIKGLFKEIIFLFNIYFSYIVSKNFYTFFSDVINNFIENKFLRNIVSVFLIFSFTLLCVNYLVEMLTSSNFFKKIIFYKIDKVLGSLFGIIRGFLIIEIFLLYLNKIVIIFDIKNIDKYINESFLISYFNNFNSYFL